MFYKIVFLLFIYNTLNANDTAYININSDSNNTTIYLDGKLIGKTPIKQYKVIPNKDIILEAKIDKKYFLKDIKSIIKIKKNKIPTINLAFEKALGKIFLVGENGELYIDGEFIKSLDAANRTIELEAKDNIIIKIKDGYKEIKFITNIYADSFEEIKYKLKNIPLDVRLYTLSIDALMWEDTKEASNSAITWEKAEDYCESFELGGFKDWKIPTVEQLELLYKHKDKLYNSYGGAFYWSSNRFQDKAKIWDYAKVKNFEDGKTKKSIIEFEQGRIRCVRDIIDENIKLKENEKEDKNE